MAWRRLGASKSEVCTCSKIQNVPVYPFVIDTRENNEMEEGTGKVDAGLASHAASLAFVWQ